MWQDTTSYSQNKQRIPTTWTLAVDDLRITVTCSHIYHRGEWIMHCQPWFDTRPLGILENVNQEEAQAKALAMVRAKIEKLHEAIQSVE